jgi:replicative DNA helicase
MTNVVDYTNAALEMRLLLALRDRQYHHLIPALDPRLFADERTRLLFDAMRQSFVLYGDVTEDGIARFYRDPLPQELSLPVHVDPFPIIDELSRLQKKRALYEVSQYVRQLSAEPDPDITHLFHVIERELPRNVRSITIQSGVDEFLSLFEARRTGTYRWLRTGLEWLDQMIGGEWPRGEISIVSARSGGGKTALIGASALNMARNYHLDQSEGSPTAIFSLEMPRPQLVARFVANLLGIDSRIVRNGMNIDGSPIAPDLIDLIKATTEEIAQLPLYIIEAEGFGADDIIATARALHVEHNVQVFFVDYLQLVKYEGDNMHYGLSSAIKRIRDFAKQYNVAFVLTAQVNETKGTIRDSTDPEKDAALWLHIDIDYESRDDQGVARTRVSVKKNRHGPTGSANVLYHSRKLAFLGMSEQYQM